MDLSRAVIILFQLRAGQAMLSLVFGLFLGRAS